MALESAFPEALITGYESLSESMPNEEKDRHILAAAVYGKVDAIVTLNTRDFPVACLSKFGIERLTPDEFLTHQWHLDKDLVRVRVTAQIADYNKTWPEHLALLAKMAPKFADLVNSSA